MAVSIGRGGVRRARVRAGCCTPAPFTERGRATDASISEVRSKPRGVPAGRHSIAVPGPQNSQPVDPNPAAL